MYGSGFVLHQFLLTGDVMSAGYCPDCSSAQRGMNITQGLRPVKGEKCNQWSVRKQDLVIQILANITIQILANITKHCYITPNMQSATRVTTFLDTEKYKLFKKILW